MITPFGTAKQPDKVLEDKVLEEVLKIGFQSLESLESLLLEVPT